MRETLSLLHFKFRSGWGHMFVLDLLINRSTCTLGYVYVEIDYSPVVIMLQVHLDYLEAGANIIISASYQVGFTRQASVIF